MKNGLESENISLLFKLRTRMLDVKENFKNLYLDTSCRFCGKSDENQRHLLNCEVIIQHCPELYNDRIVQYDDIYDENPSIQLRVTKLF